jgi:hypothetical protein
VNGKGVDSYSQALRVDLGELLAAGIVSEKYGKVSNQFDFFGRSLMI